MGPSGFFFLFYQNIAHFSASSGAPLLNTAFFSFASAQQTRSFQAIRRAKREATKHRDVSGKLRAVMNRRSFRGVSTRKRRCCGGGGGGRLLAHDAGGNEEAALQTGIKGSERHGQGVWH